MTHGLARVGAFLEMDRVTLMELSQRSRRNERRLLVAASRPRKSPPTTTPEMQYWLKQVLRGDLSLASRLDDLARRWRATEKEYLGNEA